MTWAEMVNAFCLKVMVTSNELFWVSELSSDEKLSIISIWEVDDRQYRQRRQHLNAE